MITPRDMVKGMVHGIRNPLNALQLNVDNLEGELDELRVSDKKAIPELLARIRNAITELDYFLSGVLRLADLPKPQITSLDINTLVKEVERFAKPQSSEKELTVELALQENLPEMQGDPLQVKQAILNVLLNAIEACPLNGAIVVATQATRNRIIVKVTDNGRGIPVALREHIFEPFFSTKETGVGLGLPLVLEIVKLHRGRISFTSEVGKGSAFLIALPLRAGRGAK